jgi:hypothetical protein
MSSTTTPADPAAAANAAAVAAMTPAEKTAGQATIDELTKEAQAFDFERSYIKSRLPVAFLPLYLSTSPDPVPPTA